MSKAFTSKENQENEPDEIEPEDAIPAGVKNYMTPTGQAAMQKEYAQLLHGERPKIVEIVSWAAGNGDRSENGDYIYGKKRLREIDRRLHYIKRRLESAVIVDPKDQQQLAQVFFGARVTYIRADNSTHTVMLVGVDETDVNAGRISWLSPIARALLKAKVGDSVTVRMPEGQETLEIQTIEYPLG